MNEFLGAEKKMTIEIDGTLYMVKMPDPIREKKLRAEISYKNNQFSEHIGCAIFKACDNVEFAPIYDCGSSLGALLDDEMMGEHLKRNFKLSDTEKSTFSIYKMGGQRISHIDIFKNPPDDLAMAIKELLPQIEIEKMCLIIDSVDQMSETRKEYMKQSLKLRYNDILHPSYKRLL